VGFVLLKIGLPRLVTWRGRPTSTSVFTELATFHCTSLRLGRADAERLSYVQTLRQRLITTPKQVRRR
jgi:hypothetical protein